MATPKQRSGLFSWSSAQDFAGGFSTESLYGLTASGTTQATAASASAGYSQFTSVPAGSGCILPKSEIRGRWFVIENAGANDLEVYPSLGTKFYGSSANLPYTVAAGDVILVISSAYNGSAEAFDCVTVTLGSSGGGGGGGVSPTRLLTAGAGLTGGGDLSADRTFNVGANVDGSIIVNSNDVQVGVLATDAQHGVRGGGTQHAVATTSNAGFMSADDKGKLDLFVNVLDYGADPTGVADSLAAFDAALAATSALNTLMLVIPPGNYKMSNTWVIDRPVHVLGSGTRPSAGGSTLYVNVGAGCDGILVKYFVSSPTDIGAHKSILENFHIVSSSGVAAWQPNLTNYYLAGTSTVISTAYNGFVYVCVSGTDTGPTEPTWPTTEGAQVTEVGAFANPVVWECRYIAGLKLNATCTVRNIEVSSWPGDGISVYASTGDSPATNANGFRIYDCTVGLCYRWGFFTQGADANGGVIQGCTAIINGTSGASVDVGGFCDNSFLGNVYVGNIAENNVQYGYLVPDNASVNNSTFYGNYCESGSLVNINQVASWHGAGGTVRPYGSGQIISPFRINTLYVYNDTNDDNTGIGGFTQIGKSSQVEFMSMGYGPDAGNTFNLQPDIFNGGARTGMIAWNYYSGLGIKSPYGFTTNQETTYGGGKLWIGRDFLIGAALTENVIGTAHSFPGKANYYHGDSPPVDGIYKYGAFFKEYVPYLNGGFLGYLNLQSGATGTWAPVAKAMYMRSTAVGITLNNWDWYVGVSDTSANRVITLPTMGAEDMDAIEFIIKDESGAAGVAGEIRVTPPGAELIDGVNTYKAISTPYGSLTVIRRNGQWFTNGSSASGTQSVVDRTASLGLGVGGSGTLYTNIGAAGGITFTLPTAVAGLRYKFACMEAFTLTIQAAGSDLIYNGTSVSTAGGTLASNTVSSTIELVGVSGGRWIAFGPTGSWAAA